MGDKDISAVVAAAELRYAQRRPESRRLAAQASTWLPGGNTRSVLDFAPFPFRVATTDGPYLVDVDGHRYLDLLGNYTAGLLGHHPDWVEQIFKEIATLGVSLGGITTQETAAARLICERFPSIEQVRMTNSGTEANLMAIATATHHTGRAKIVVCRGGYHGGVLYFGAGGDPLLVPHEWVFAEFNDVASIEAAFAAHGHEIACVLVEPMLGAAGCIPAQPGYLETLRALCTHHGALLIFDEVMTSRLSSGGAQQLLGIKPDMTTLGKYLAGGFNFGAFGGRREVMAAFDRDAGGSLAHGGTFNNNPLSVAGVVVTLGLGLSEDLLARVNTMGDGLRDRLGAGFADSGVPMSVTGLGSVMNVHGRSKPPSSVAEVAGGDDRWKAILFFHLLEAGYYIARRGFISLSADITEPDVDGFAAAVEQWVDDPLVVA